MSDNEKVESTVLTTKLLKLNGITDDSFLKKLNKTRQNEIISRYEVPAPFAKQRATIDHASKTNRLDQRLLTVMQGDGETGRFTQRTMSEFGMKKDDKKKHRYYDDNISLTLARMSAYQKHKGKLNEMEQVLEMKKITGVPTDPKISKIKSLVG